MSYLCIMKNVNDMEEILVQRGFLRDREHNGWRKNDWIIRFVNNDIEAYNDPVSKTINKYFYYNKSIVDLQDVLDEIDNYLSKK